MSWPTAALETQYLKKFLSVEQALADAANFIETMKKEKGWNGKWVVWGCSYSGALSSWVNFHFCLCTTTYVCLF